MTVKELKQIISALPDETILLIDGDEVKDVKLVNIMFHSDGRSHLIFSSLE